MTLKNFPAFLILFFCSVINLYAQHSKIDSLKTVLTQAKNDTDKINNLISLSAEIKGIRPDSSIVLAKKALALSRSILWGKGVIISQQSLGNYYERQGDLKKALNYEDSALASSKKYKYDKKLGSIYNALGNIASDQSDYTNGLNFYFQALHIDSLQGGTNTPGIYNNIGSDYQEMGNYVKAEEYYLKTEKIYEGQNSKKDLGIIYGNLGTLYYLEDSYKKGLEYNIKALVLDSTLHEEMKLIADYEDVGLGYIGVHNYSYGLDYIFKSIALSYKLEEFSNIPKTFSNIGGAFLDFYQSDSNAGEFIYRRNGTLLHVAHSALLDSAMIYEQNCLHTDTVNDQISLLYANRYIGDIYALRKNYLHAISYYQSAYKLADSLGALFEKMEIARTLGNTFIKTDNYPMGVKYLNNFINLRDTIFNKDKDKLIAEMEAKYENEKKQKEIETLAQKNEIQNLQIKQSTYFIFGLASLVLLIAAMAFLLIRQNRINTLNTKIELEQKLLRSQMNPHFIFNAITSIQNYIYKEEPQTAANYLSSIFKLMRAILESSKKEYVLLDKEIAALKEYLVLQQLCYQNKFDFKIDVNPDMDIENIMIPPMMAQPFIENAIEHGTINNPDKKGTILIRLLLHYESFSLEIEDNGIGREKAREFNRIHNTGNHLSVATNITEERIILLNKKLKRKITMHILDLKNDKNEPSGTKVMFFFPLNLMA